MMRSKKELTALVEKLTAQLNESTKVVNSQRITMQLLSAELAESTKVIRSYRQEGLFQQMTGKPLPPYRESEM